MHLQDSEGGGTAYGAPNSTEAYGNSHTVDPSSSRTIHLQSGAPSNQSVAEFLLAWTLVLYRDNDDSLGSVNWGYSEQATTLAPARALDVKALPFTKGDSLADALEAVRQLSPSDENSTAPQHALYFNNGVEGVRVEAQKQTRRRPHNVSHSLLAQRPRLL